MSVVLYERPPEMTHNCRPGDDRKRVLVVDDEPALLQLIKMVLDEGDGAHPGFCVGTANDGDVALSTMNGGWGPDLILMDLMMPRLPGSVAIARIKARPEWAHIPIIAMSAGTNLRREQVGGASALLAKPFDIDNLVAQVRFWVDRHENQDKVIP